MSIAPGFALTDEEAWQALRLLPPIPGARSAAMGGAGLALVDDPSATRANPARLAAISTPAVLAEGRFETFKDASLGETQALDPAINPVAETRLDVETTTDSRVTPSFVGYAHPLTLLGRPLVVAGSRTQWIDLSAASVSTTRTTPLSALPTPGAGDEVTRISDSRLDLKVEIWSAAAGWRITPTFAAGAALQVSRLDLDSSTLGLLADPLQFTRPGMVDPTFGTPIAEPLLSTRSRGTDTAFGFSFGAWWKPTPSFSLGSVYRSGARLEVGGRTADLLSGAQATFNNEVRTPDAAGLGLAWMPFRSSASGLAQGFTVALDIERVEYSDLAEGMKIGRSIQTSGLFAGSAGYNLDDAVEIRAGVETSRSFTGWSLALRGGIYTEHEARPALRDLSGDVGLLTGQSAALERAGFLEQGDTEPHLTLGAGARFYAFGFDSALDMSDPATRVIVSGSWRRR